MIVFEREEVRDLVKAWVMISLAFAIVFSGGLALSAGFLVSFIVAGLTVGLGFLFHELAHKIVAVRYGCVAEFRARTSMLVLAVVMSFFGFVFAAPGAVWISGHVSRRQHGIIAAVGPLMNLILAVVFIPFLFFYPLIGSYGVMINAWLALFNLLPLPGFDGSKVLAWSKLSYVALFVPSLIMSFVTYLPVFS